MGRRVGIEEIIESETKKYIEIKKQRRQSLFLLLVLLLC
jgi:hypothetical protein